MPELLASAFVWGGFTQRMPVERSWRKRLGVFTGREGKNKFLSLTWGVPAVCSQGFQGQLRSVWMRRACRAPRGSLQVTDELRSWLWVGVGKLLEKVRQGDQGGNPGGR